MSTLCHGLCPENRTHRAHRFDPVPQFLDKLGTIAAQVLGAQVWPLPTRLLPLDEQIDQAIFEGAVAMGRPHGIDGESEGELSGQGHAQPHAGRHPAAVDRLLGHAQHLGGLGLGQALIPEQVEDLAILVREALDLAVELGPGAQTGRVIRIGGHHCLRRRLVRAIRRLLGLVVCTIPLGPS